MSYSDLNNFQTFCRARLEQALEDLLPPVTTRPVRLHEAMRYAVLGSGKRIRPLLTYATGEALGVDSVWLDHPACAIEFIHAYSLIHDDLPAMDDDDLRRGRPTCHRAFDEATAILAGDALQTLAFQVIAEASELQTDNRVQMIAALARASGSRGMAGGQALDLESAGKPVELVTLEQIHLHKTGALIHAAVQLGMFACGTIPASQNARLDHYAKCLGLAFQIQDDVLDVEGETDQIGKTAKRDQALAKATYPALLGLTAAKEMAHTLIQDALTALADFSATADPLRWIAEALIGRKN